MQFIQLFIVMIAIPWQIKTEEITNRRDGIAKALMSIQKI